LAQANGLPTSLPNFLSSWIMPGAMARRPILSIGICSLVALSFLNSTNHRNFFATSTKAAHATSTEASPATSAEAAPATESASSMAAEASSKQRTSRFGPASLKMLVSAADLPIFFSTQKTAAKIFTSRRGDWFPFFVTRKPLKTAILTGEVDEVCATVKKLSELLEEKNGNSEPHRFLVPRAAQGLLIGSGGTNIENARSETGATIWIENTPGSEDIVFIQGTSQTVTAAAKWLLDTLQGEGIVQRLNTWYHTGGSSSHQTELDLHIPKDKVGFVIGKGGTSLVRYGQDCLCELKMDSEKCTLKIKGSLGDVQMAVRYIMQDLSIEPK